MAHASNRIMVTMPSIKVFAFKANN